MISFSKDPKRAEQEMHAIIFYLTTFGHIDGDFDNAEKSFVREYIRKLIEQRASSAMTGVDPKMRDEVIAKYTKHFHEVFEGIDANVKDLFTEAVSDDEDPKKFVHNRLKVKCFEIFHSFDQAGQEQLLSTIDELLAADGVSHPAEVEFRGELSALLEAHYGVELDEVESDVADRISVREPRVLPKTTEDHGFFASSEHHFSKDKEKMNAQISADLALVDRALRVLHEQREKGEGKLKGKMSLADVPAGSSFLDGHVYVTLPAPQERFELTVLGDLHGCYSVLKATIMQSRFFERVDAYRKNPKTTPKPILVLLGDYIDRGLFSLNGVLRTALQLFVTAPDHVVLLRGNHEYFIEFKGMMYGGVKPAESINTLKPHLSVDVFRRYRDLFEALPNLFFFDRVCFVHGGIPRDRAFKEKYKDLSSLNDSDLRFQMMWSDPSKADVIPADLQDSAARFSFGKLQFRAFMQKVGAQLMVRGHEKVLSGFDQTYDDKNARLITLFSSGGANNADLPQGSSYREVTPMALTMAHANGETELTPWVPDFASYNDPVRNAFFKVPPEIEHTA